MEERPMTDEERVTDEEREFLGMHPTVTLEEYRRQKRHLEERQKLLDDRRKEMQKMENIRKNQPKKKRTRPSAMNAERLNKIESMAQEALELSADNDAALKEIQSVLQDIQVEVERMGLYRKNATAPAGARVETDFVASDIYVGQQGPIPKIG